jgi:hypothetical protein
MNKTIENTTDFEGNALNFLAIFLSFNTFLVKINDIYS